MIMDTASFSGILRTLFIIILVYYAVRFFFKLLAPTLVQHVVKKAGENLAYASTLAEAHRGLMNSPSHRDAILNKSFGRIGIGVIDGGKSGLMISQEFKD